MVNLENPIPVFWMIAAGIPIAYIAVSLVLAVLVGKFIKHGSEKNTHG